MEGEREDALAALPQDAIFGPPWNIDALVGSLIAAKSKYYEDQIFHRHIPPAAQEINV